MRKAMETGRVTSHDLGLQYLTRIALYENKLHAVITTNPNVLAEPDERDRERAAGRVRGPLHGIPIALKDNILTHDIVTTGGALAFEGYTPPYDATLAKNLRDAGAVIIAKTTPSELASWVAGAPTPMPANYDAVRGSLTTPMTRDVTREPRRATEDRSFKRADPVRAQVRPATSGRQCGKRNLRIYPEPFESEYAGSCEAHGGANQPLLSHSDHG